MGGAGAGRVTHGAPHTATFRPIVQMGSLRLITSLWLCHSLSARGSSWTFSLTSAPRSPPGPDGYRNLGWDSSSTHLEGSSSPGGSSPAGLLAVQGPWGEQREGPAAHPCMSLPGAPAPGNEEGKHPDSEKEA